MRLTRPLSTTKIIAFALGATVAATILILSFSPYGSLRATYDSQDLIEASSSFQTYLTGKNEDGHSYLVRAPLHPFILSFFQDKMLVMWWLNVLSLLASLVLIYQVCRLKKFSTTISLAVVAVLISFYPWLMNFQFFWTEAVFILLILSLAYSRLRAFPSIIIVFICLTLFFTRKSGIFFFPACALSYFVEKDWRNALLLFVSGIFVFAGWQWIEFSYGSSGYFGLMLETLDEYSRSYYVDAVTSWFLPMQIPLLFRTIIVTLSLIAVMVYFRHHLFPHFRQQQNLILLSIACVYTFILVSFSGASGYEDAERYLNVVSPLWLILVISFLSSVVGSLSKQERIAVITTGSLWLVYTFLRTMHHLIQNDVSG
jgi:hypothetical protein